MMDDELKELAIAEKDEFINEVIHSYLWISCG